MIGLIRLLIVGTLALKSYGEQSCKNETLDRKFKDEAIETGTPWYIHHDGSTRLVSDNRKVYVGFYHTLDRGRRYVIQDVKTGKILKDYTQEEMDNEFPDVVAELPRRDRMDSHWHDKIRGPRYKDKITGEIYVVRDLDGSLFSKQNLKHEDPKRWYMNLKGDFVKPVEKCDCDYEEIKEKLNNRDRTKHSYDYYFNYNVSYR